MSQRLLPTALGLILGGALLSALEAPEASSAPVLSSPAAAEAGAGARALPQDASASEPPGAQAAPPTPERSDDVVARSPLSGILAIPPGTLLTPQQLPTGDLGRGVQNLKRLDLSGARRELMAFEALGPTGDDKIRAIFFRGAIEMAEGAYGRAAETFASIQNGIPGLSVEIAAREGRARLLSGEPKLAGDRLSAAARSAPTGGIARALQLESARAYTQAGWFKTAGGLLDALKEDPDAESLAGEIALAEAQLLLAKGQLSAARDGLQALQGDAEDCAIVEAVGGHLRALEAEGTPDLPGALSKELARVDRLIACQDYEDAEARLKAVAEVHPEEALEQTWINLWYRRWDLDQVTSYAQTRLQGPLSDDQRRGMLRWMARAAWREGAAEHAADLRADAAALQPNPIDTDDQYYLGLLYTEAHAFEKGEPLLASALDGRLTQRKRVEVLWYQAWGSLMQGDLAAARERLTAFHERYTDEQRGLAAQYWLARVDIIEGHGAEALKRLDAMEAEEPDSFYVFLARSLKLHQAALQASRGIPVRPAVGPGIPLPEGEVAVAVAPTLNIPALLALPASAPWQRVRPHIPGPGETPFLDLPSPLRPERPEDIRALEDGGLVHLEGLSRVYGADVPELPIALALAQAGFRQEGSAWLEQAYLRSRRSKDAKERRFSRERDSLYYSFWLLGNPLQTLRLDPTGWPFPKLNLEEPASTEPWRRRYPRVFANEVSHAHFSWGVDPSLIYGIMRTESIYGPQQLSPVGARGLMQIMPRTGERIAGILGEPFHLDDLYDPGTNIWYGAWYLSQLLERFDGQLPLAIAAYNCGPQYVSNWIHRSGDVPVDVFIEEIPIGQTRNYVKKVLRAMAIYRGLYAGGPQLPLSATLSPDEREGVDF